MPDKLAPVTPTELSELRKTANTFLRQRRPADADSVAHRMLEAEPDAPDGWIFRARAAQQRNDFFGAATFTQKALSLAPDRLDVRLVAAEAGIYVGYIAETLSALRNIETVSEADTATFKQLSALYTQLGRHKAAYRTARKARDLSPESLNLLYLVASAAIAVGKLDEAETLLNEIIQQAPNEGDIYYNRATLRKQTKERHHIDQLKDRLTRTPQNDQRETPLCYALGKELEDVGDYENAFSAFSRGAQARKARLAYDVSTDTEAANNIIEVFDTNWWRETSKGSAVEGPIFVMGLPRSGTTLVERILSAHPDVASLGEVNDFAYAVVRAGYPAADKTDLIKRSATADLTELGHSFWSALRGYGEDEPYLIDKTPANYLYLGLIAKALPKARIIHVRRHPLASGYAMYKTLFRMGYPFSYDLEDIGRYYLSYDRLMSHWHTLFSERILDVDYEALVDDQEGISRRIVKHCDLPWSDDCLTFHKNAAPTATASAAQVRQPIYRDARDIWRNYEHHLGPLARVLEDGGLQIS